MKNTPAMKASPTEQVRQLIQETKENEISRELVLDSLREKGIHDLNDFIAQSIKARNANQARTVAEIFPELKDRTYEDAMVELLFGKKAQSDARNCSYAEPRLPFVHGNSHYKASEISRFNGKVVHYVWDSEMVGNGFLKAVTDPAEYREFVNGSTTRLGNGPEPFNHVPGAGHTFYQHINFGGYVLNLGYRHAFPDLTGVTMSGFWFWATSWNDQISSLRTGSGPVILGANIMNPYLTGPTTTVQANTSIPWIGQAWNDRVSAILG